jgi:hypothetical protein
MAFNANGQWKMEDDSVAPRVDAIMGKDSALMQTAQGMGTALANRRGLQNSSIGTGAVTKSMLDAAIPIASQDSQQTYGKNIQGMNDQLAREKIAADQQAILANLVQSAGASYQGALGQIATNPKMSSNARGQFMGSAKDQLGAQIAVFERLYGTNLKWGTPPAGDDPGRDHPGQQ